MVKKISYDWKKTAKKFLFSALYVVLAGAAVVYADNPVYIAIAPLLHAAENWLKHKK